MALKSFKYTFTGMPFDPTNARVEFFFICSSEYGSDYGVDGVSDYYLDNVSLTRTT